MLCDDQDGATLTDMQEAAEIIQEALNLHPDVAEYWVCQAQMQVRNENFPDAINSLRRAIQINPSHPFAADFLSDLEDFEEGQKQQARTAASKPAGKHKRGKTDE